MYLQNQFLPLTESQPAKKTTTSIGSPKPNNPITHNADDQKVMQQVIHYYHATLQSEPEALAYLQKRGLDSAELIEHFTLGYANRTLGKCLPIKERTTGAAIRSQLKSIGLFRETGREHFCGSLVVPVMNVDGVITEVYGRKLLDSLRKGTPKHTYLPGPHEGVFNPSSLAASNDMILCESLLDALTFWRWGFKNVTSSYGVNGFTDELLQAFIDHNIQRVMIAYDRDEAGDRAAIKVAEVLNKHGIEAYRVQFPKGMDANQYALQVTPAEKSLSLVLRHAELLGEPQAQIEPAVVVAENKQNERVESVPQSISPSNINVVTQGTDIFITLENRVYRARGTHKNTDPTQLKIQLMVSQNDHMHMDRLDLTSSKQRQVFINQASTELDVKDETIKKDLSKVLLTLEEQLTQLQSKNNENRIKPLTDQEQQEALDLLQDPSLFSRILEDFSCAGVVGEESNKLVGYLACVSRKLDKPLAVMIQSSSAAGKSSLMDSILGFIPEEERVQYSAMSGQSLFYMSDTNLKHKILAIAEEEGASNASYALKLLQSEGEVTMASTGKDESTGNLVTKEYKVEGPVMLFLTTTAIDIDEELMNRCLVLSVNETIEQTEIIHRVQRQRRTLEGLQRKVEKEAVIKHHHNAQRLLKPFTVINPYADHLTFLSDKTRTRRDHEKYLTLIDSIALLHQHQRKIKTTTHMNKTIEYIEVALSDIEKANHLAHEVLGRTLDELPPQTRKLLKLIQSMVAEIGETESIIQQDLRFSRKDIRLRTGWTDNQLKVHCARLTEMEYLLSHRGGRGQSLEYELIYDGDIDDQQRYLMKLIDTNTLKQHYDHQKLDLKNTKLDSSCPQVGGVLGPSCGGVNGSQISSTNTSSTLGGEVIIKHSARENKNPHIVSPV